jgi:hypothetical protein
MREDWKEELADFFRETKSNEEELVRYYGQTKQEVAGYLKDTVHRGLAEVCPVLSEHGREGRLYSSETGVEIVVSNAGVQEFKYEIEVDIYPRQYKVFAIDHLHDRENKRELSKDEYPYHPMKSDIIEDFIGRYKIAVSLATEESWKE